MAPWLLAVRELPLDDRSQPRIGSRGRAVLQELLCAGARPWWHCREALVRAREGA